MKRLLSLIAVLAVLSAAAVTAMSFSLGSQKDKVVITENVIFGDSTYANGLTMRILSTYQNHIYFDTIYNIGTSLCETDYKYYQNKHYQTEERTYAGVDIGSALRYGFDLRTPESELKGLDKAYRELYDETPVGETRRKFVYLQDLYDYYPIYLSISLPGTNYIEEDYDDSLEFDNDIYGGSIDIWQKFSEFFKIPVPKDLPGFYIGIQKNSAQSVGIETSEGKNQYYFNTISAYTSATCFFSIENKIYPSDDDGEVKYVDTSLIPGGYGIYAIDYKNDTSNKSGTNIDADSLRTVYPLEKDVVVKNMFIRNNETELLLLTEESGVTYLTAIDIATMTAKQKISIGKYDYYNVYLHDEFIVIDDVLYLSLIKIENGKYDLTYTVKNNSEITNTWYSDPGYVKVALDGERLAILSSSFSDSGHQLCGAILYVYDRSGLVYTAEYKSSLSPNYLSYSYKKNCYPIEFELDF